MLRLYRSAVLLCLLFFIPGCGKTPTPVEPLDVSSISVGASQQTNDPVNSLTHATSDKTIPIINISWGFHPELRGLTSENPDYGKRLAKVKHLPKIPVKNPVAQYLNSKYYIVLEGTSLPANIYNADILPDFFYTDHPSVMYERGMTRAIPRDMIESYAPGYAELLYKNPVGWQLNKKDNNEYFGLCLYDDYYDRLNTYSIYRLDWLEKLGIQPNGSLTEIEDRVFFTDTAFNMEEYKSIMQRFTRDNSFLKETVYKSNRIPAFSISNLEEAWDNTYGMEITMQHISFFDSLSIMGMWGVNNTIMKDADVTVPFYASKQYREFLIYLADLSSQDVFELNFFMNQKVCSMYNLTGMWNDNIYSLFFNYKFILDNIPEACLLITPPETSSLDKSGAGAAKSSHPYGVGGAWVAGANVSDEKLARILELFDGISCDPETYITVTYGFEGDNYIWSDKPYDSRIIELNVTIPINEGVRVFSTNIQDERVAKPDYWTGRNVLTEYAGSAAARNKLLWPHKEDLLGVYAGEKALLDEIFDESLNKIIFKYFESVVRKWDKNDVTSTWDEYIYELNQNGLQEYIELYKKYPD
jgi:hypothetical protein